ncbi:uncharacterized protein LACBIDRAFT_297389 [Laccaria bicolor S238N-H82]|uniref:Predicted protein n=1 Tax=Laccaria bicolor (strain S238N-H82 / ATCC MYA-4686) TaxID=486041 RepID=B0DAN3_LACBS|nr:uncharacterized protein LACBIDRAFT_297389 [Laccaria bicolor S238N-H82]EDR08780.1 predicted protein [Laccaria bicolor S238N-H82]|eukprot:XP_001881005.1 predicted protein [Laccaria bicolor S238N-H82]
MLLTTIYVEAQMPSKIEGNTPEAEMPFQIEGNTQVTSFSGASTNHPDLLLENRKDNS